MIIHVGYVVNLTCVWRALWPIYLQKSAREKGSVYHHETRKTQGETLVQTTLDETSYECAGETTLKSICLFMYDLVFIFDVFYMQSEFSQVI